MLFSLFTAPSATGTLASVGEWSSPVFDNFLPIVYIVSGAIIGALLVVFLKDSVIHAVERLIGRTHDDKFS